MGIKLRDLWKKFSAEVLLYSLQHEQSKSNFAFSFAEGNFSLQFDIEEYYVYW